jgi:hypothetical protein
MTSAAGHGRVRLLVAVARLVAVVVLAAGAVAAMTGGRHMVATWIVKAPAGTSATPPTGPGSASAAAGLPTSYTVPGTPPQLPWPGTGQASVRCPASVASAAHPTNTRCRSPA